MAAPPPIRKLAPEQVPAEHRKWMERGVLEPLNRFLGSVADALAGGLTSANLRAETVDVKVTIPADFVAANASDGTPVPADCWPQRFATKFAKVAKVDLAQAVASDNSLHAGVTFQWMPAVVDKKPAVEIRNATGLVAGKKYTLTFVVYGAD
jgi:hypothetical protein